MKIQRINTFFFGIPIFLQNGNIKGHSLWFKLITTSNYKMFNIHVHIQECVEWNLSKKHAMCSQYRSGLMKTRTKINRLWSASTVITVTVTESADTQILEGRGCCGNGRLHLMSEDDEGDSFLWIWGDAAHRQKMEYVCESWNLNTILLSNRNPSVI